MRIFLIGPMAAGKTSVGKMLAGLLQLSFIDSDVLLQERQLQTIPQIFQCHGEDYFRCLESTLLEDITNINDIVLATGGGCILSAKTREYLHNRGFVCYLRVNLQQQLLRLYNDTSRPTLQVTDRVNFLHKMQLQRSRLYESIANISINTDNKSIDDLANGLASILK